MAEVMKYEDFKSEGSEAACKVTIRSQLTKCFGSTYCEQYSLRANW